MKRIARAVLFIAVSVTGIASLLATVTVPIPSARLTVTTLNDFGYPYGSDQVYACRDETINLSWDTYSYVSTLELSARPAEHLSPALTLREVDATGQLGVTVLDNAELKLSANDDNPDSTVDVRLLPDTLCTSFNFPLAGWYSGTLEQTSPSPETLSRELRLYVQEAKASELTLLIDTNTNFYFDQYNDSPPTCQLRVEEAALRCAGNETDSSFTFDAQITESGLVGRYSGTSTNVNSVVPFAGTFTFEKQTGTPPQEQP